MPKFNPMTVGDLKELIKDCPDDMQIVYRCYSDLAILEQEEVEQIQAVPRDGWCMRTHPTMSEENKAATRTYLLFPGN